MTSSNKTITQNFSGDYSKKELFKIPVDDLDYGYLYKKIKEAISSKNKIVIDYINANTVRLLRKNKALGNALISADIIHPDGIGIWFASKILDDLGLRYRFNYTDWSLKFLEDCQNKGWSLFLLGSSDDMLKKAVRKLEGKFPRLKIAGTLNGYSGAEIQNPVGIINEKDSDILWVGMGTPKQELWIDKNKDKLNCNVIQSVGDLITYLAGEKTRGPAFIQKLGLEWSSRVLRHPIKYFDRYIIGIPVFFFLLLKQFILKTNKN